jgi:hypothetical protein
MRKVLYNTSIADPFVKVAQQLQEENGYEPVYWIGFDYDHSDEIVPKAFPNCVYQPYPDAWKGIFSKEIQERAAECYLDVDILNRLSRYELQAMTMMNRMDYDRYSFNYMERERHYLNLIKSWTAVLDMYKIDLVVSSVMPHRVYDYVLYLLCKERGIKYIILQYTLCEARTFATDNIYSIGKLFLDDYKKYQSNVNLSNNDLPDDIRKAYEKVQKNYDEAKPYYMNQHEKQNKRYNNLFLYTLDYLKRYNIRSILNVVKKGSVSVTMRKNRKYSLEDAHFNILDMFRIEIRKKKYNKELLSFYQSLTAEPSPDEKYILFPLHYQPEATTSPTGDIFVNQRLCVETILKNTPNDWFVYVKEHPQQFQSHMLGHTSRIKEMYSDLLMSKRVKLMPLDRDTFSIMKDAKAVATVIGTVGWEAVMHRIPVIMFGLFWYENMPGVLRITNSNSACEIMEFIENYQFNEHKVLAYLKSVADNTILAYHYDGEKENANVSEEETIKNIKNLILLFEGL